MTNTEHNQRRVKMLTAEELKKFERNLMTIKGKRLEWYLEVQPFNTFSDFIKSSFSWAHSPEHHTYWSELSDRLEPAPYSDWLTPRLRELERHHRAPISF